VYIFVGIFVCIVFVSFVYCLYHSWCIKMNICRSLLLQTLTNVKQITVSASRSVLTREAHFLASVMKDISWKVTENTAAKVRRRIVISEP